MLQASDDLKGPYQCHKKKSSRQTTYKFMPAQLVLINLSSILTNSQYYNIHQFKQKNAIFKSDNNGQILLNPCCSPHICRTDWYTTRVETRDSSHGHNWLITTSFPIIDFYCESVSAICKTHGTEAEAPELFWLKLQAQALPALHVCNYQLDFAVIKNK